MGTPILCVWKSDPQFLRSEKKCWSYRDAPPPPLPGPRIPVGLARFHKKNMPAYASTAGQYPPHNTSHAVFRYERRNRGRNAREMYFFQPPCMVLHYVLIRA